MSNNYELEDNDTVENKAVDSLVFRLAKDDDLPRILQIWMNGLKQVNPLLQLNDTHTGLFVSNFKNRNGFYNFWVAEQLHVIGWCSVLPAFSHPLKQENNGEVSTYIDNSLIAKGIGTKMMAFVFKQLAVSTIEAVYGFATPSNLSSIKMCERAGMKICGQTSHRVILIKEYI